MADVEVYKELPFSKLYHISNMWNVKSFARNTNGLVLKQKHHNMWYMVVSIDWKEYLSHRLVACTFLWLDINDSTKSILHNNDIKTDNRIENLRIWTQAENMKDSYRNGRKSTIQNFVRRWVENENAKLKEENIYEIFKLAKEWMSQLSISNIFWVRQDNICRILQWKRWKHITLNLI